MSELTDALDYIINWLKSTNLEFIDCYNLGLTRKKINEIVRDLPFQLSEEIYELYQWRNKAADLGFNNYYPIDGEEDEVVIRIDEQKLELEKAIYRKYNS